VLFLLQRPAVAGPLGAAAIATKNTKSTNLEQAGYFAVWFPVWAAALSMGLTRKQRAGRWTPEYRLDTRTANR
jgi:hypothetical protein